MRIARVFPRRTTVTPSDSLAFCGPPPLGGIDVDEVHVSVTFTYDCDRASWLADQWKPIAPVRMGGPALGQPGGEFVPGRYMKPGYVITSRGCPNTCWFCDVWRRRPEILELPICNGSFLQDDNILACSEQHIRAVFRMLAYQPRRATFCGGLEAARLQPWHVDLLLQLRPNRIFFAYDDPLGWEPLRAAADLLWSRGFPPRSRPFTCYILSGYPGDTLLEAEARCVAVFKLGFLPMAMVYRDKTGIRTPEWTSWGWRWSWPPSVVHRCQDALSLE